MQILPSKSIFYDKLTFHETLRTLCKAMLGLDVVHKIESKRTLIQRRQEFLHMAEQSRQRISKRATKE